MTIRRTRILAFLSVLTSTACAERAPSLTGIDAIDLVFLTQSEPQTAHMDALFTGSVVVDQMKCTRMVDADRATIIWPPGFTVSGANGALVVRDGTACDESHTNDAGGVSDPTARVPHG